MATYRFNEMGGIEIDFNGVKPDFETRTKMKSVKYRWNPNRMIWLVYKNNDTVAMAKYICRNSENAFSKSMVSTTAATFDVTEVPVMNKRCCYFNTIDGFLNESKENWLKIMQSAFSVEYVMSLGESQIYAWADCYDVLQEQLPDFNEKAHGFNIIFEYALPYESGRRPDVILVSEEFVLILEFKMKNEILKPDVDQVCAYTKDIREYHYESRNKYVKPFLVLTHAKKIRTDLSHKYGNLSVCSKELLAVTVCDALCSQQHKHTITPCDVKKRMSSKYTPSYNC